MSKHIARMSETRIVPNKCRELRLPLHADIAHPLRDKGVFTGGLSDLEAPYEIIRPDPGFHAILFTLSGEGCIEGVDFASTMLPGQVWLLPSHTPYRYWAESPWRMMWFHLDDTGEWKRLRGRPLGHHAAEDVERLEMLMGAYIDEALRYRGDVLRMAGAIAEMIVLYLRREIFPQRGQGVGEPTKDRIATLWDAVRDDPGRQWTVETMASIVHVSSPYLHQLVSAGWGTTPMGMVNRIRMQKAGELLMDTSLPIGEIGGMVGYSSPYAFSKAFKRHTGKSPRASRK